MRLDKFMSQCGLGTRSEVKKILKTGCVTINGIVAGDGKQQVKENEDVVCCQGRPLTYEAFEYYMFHKPAGCVCANRDAVHETVFSYVPMNARGDLFTVGRLDLDTEGLLLITNDGIFAHHLLSPGKHVEKCYLAHLNQPATPEDVLRFAQGIDIGEQHRTKPAQLSIDPTDGTKVRITIAEGMYHQVKRMMHACGKEVIYLKRLTMGAFVLDESLALGAYRKFTEREMDYVTEYKSSYL